MNAASFSPLEIQLVRSSLSTKTNEEIAELLERSMEDVIELINDITGGKAEERTQDVAVFIEEKQREVLRKKQEKKKKIPPAGRNIRRPQDKPKVNTRTKERLEAEKGWMIQREAHRKREDVRKYKTREIDFTKTISVKLDDKTYAQVEPQETKEKTDQLIALVIANYNLNKTLNKFKINQNAEL